MSRCVVFLFVLTIALNDVNAIFNISAYWRKGNHEKNKNVGGYFEKHFHVHGRPPIESNKHYLGTHYVANEHHDHHQDHDRDPHYGHRYEPWHQQNVQSGVPGQHHDHRYSPAGPQLNIQTHVPQHVVMVPHYYIPEEGVQRIVSSKQPVVIDDIIYEPPPYEPIRTIDDSFAELTGIATENPDVYDFVRNDPHPPIPDNHVTVEVDDESHHKHHEIELKPTHKPEYHNIHKTINNELKNIEDNINLSGAKGALEIIVDISPLSNKPRLHIQGHEHPHHHHEKHHDNHNHHKHHKKHNRHKVHHHQEHHHNLHNHHSHDHHYKHHPNDYHRKPKHHHTPTTYIYHEDKHHHQHEPAHHHNIFQRGKSFSEAYFRQWHK